jgi:hypothetical protein
MAVFDENLRALQPRSGALLVVVPFVILLLRTVYRIFFHPLSHVPGPFLPKITSLWLHYHAYIGDDASAIRRLHAIYGPYARAAACPVVQDRGEEPCQVCLAISGIH